MGHGGLPLALGALALDQDQKGIGKLKTIIVSLLTCTSVIRMVISMLAIARDLHDDKAEVVIVRGATIGEILTDLTIGVKTDEARVLAHTVREPLQVVSHIATGPRVSVTKMVRTMVWEERPTGSSTAEAKAQILDIMLVAVPLRSRMKKSSGTSSTPCLLQDRVQVASDLVTHPTSMQEDDLVRATSNARQRCGRVATLLS